MGVSTVAVAVLAAGRGSKIDGSTPKPLLVVGGRPLVSWALDAALGSELRPVVLVIGHQGMKVEQVAPQGVTVVRARGWRGGVNRSLRTALEALDGWAQIDAVCIGNADQARVGSEAYRRLAAAYDDGASLAVATYGGGRAGPVLLGRSLWPEARKLTGDVGVRALLRTHAVVEVPCDGTGDPAGVDTIEDLRAMQDTWHQETES